MLFRSIALQLFDKWYAYRQSLNDPTYKADVTVSYSDTSVPNAVNIWLDVLPASLDKRLLEYDLVFLCNGGEPLSTSATNIMKVLSARDNVYFVVDLYVTQDHPLQDKIIWYSVDNLNCNDSWIRSFYPHFYENHKKLLTKRSGNVCAINGENRMNRKMFFDTIKTQIPSLAMKDSYNAGIVKLAPSLWESADDREFREYVNSLYQETDTRVSNTMLRDRVNIGIDNKFGSLQPGYIILDEYFEYNCAVFPEITWQNDELCLTEKALKCFYEIGRAHV